MEGIRVILAGIAAFFFLQWYVDMLREYHKKRKPTIDEWCGVCLFSLVAITGVFGIIKYIFL